MKCLNVIASLTICVQHGFLLVPFTYIFVVRQQRREIDGRGIIDQRRPRANPDEENKNTLARRGIPMYVLWLPTKGWTGS